MGKADRARFADSFARILRQHERLAAGKEDGAAKGSSTILALSKSTQRKLKQMGREEAKEERAKTEATPSKIRRTMEGTHRVRLTMSKDDHERRLIKIATKGVVQLFNAVTKAQARPGANAAGAGPDGGSRKKTAAKLSRGEFIDILKSSAASTTLKARADPSDAAAGDGGLPAWLRDGAAAPTGQAKDWDLPT